MARQGINTGSSPDAGDGDALLIGAIKINNNFDEIYTLLGDGTNLSPGIVTSIVAGTNVTVSGSTGQVTINASGAGGSSSQWVSTAAGIHTLSNVGIGTTNPTSALTVKGNTSLETLSVSDVSTFIGIVGIGTTNASSKLTVVGDFVTGDPNDGNSQFKVDTVGNASISPGRLLYLNGTSTNVGLKWTSGLGVELYNSSNLGGSDRNITIASVNSGAVTLIGGGGGTLRINSSGLEVIGVTTSNFSGDVKVGVDTSTGLILTSPNGTAYRLVVDDSGTLSTVDV